MRVYAATSRDARLTDWVNVVAFTQSGELIVVRQHRLGVGKLTEEIPAGKIEPGESARAAARRELREETGYASEQLKALGSRYCNPALQDNKLHTFLALSCSKIASARDPKIVTLVPRARLERFLARVDNVFTCYALHLAKATEDTAKDASRPLLATANART